MNNVLLLELLVAGFFAVACFRARPQLRAGEKPKWESFFRLTSRIERLRRSRWQWFSMVAVLLVLRMQNQLPAAVEIMVGMMFLIFLVFPVQQVVRARR